MVGSGIGGKGGVAGGSKVPMNNPSAPMPNRRTPLPYDPAVKSASPSVHQPPMPETPSYAGYQPLAPQGDFNVNNAAAGGLQQAMQGTQAAMAGPNVGAFMNPYTSMVTGTALNDLERQRQMMANTTGAQASQAGAFGGSRHGVADALTNEAFAREGSQMFGNLQQQGYNNALTSAENQQRIQMGGAAQMGQLGNQAYNTGRTIRQDQSQQGLLQQGMQQALIDAAKNQYSNYANAPTQSLGAPLAALGSTPNQSTTTQSAQPGLLNYLSAIVGMGA